MPLQPAGEIEFQKDHEHLRRMEPGMPDQFVDADGRRAERLDDTPRSSSPGGGVGGKIRRLLERPAAGSRPPDSGASAR